MKNYPQKVLFVSSLYHPNKGGIENSIKEMTSYLVDNNVECHLICSDRNNINSKALKKNEIKDNLNIHRYHYGTGIFSIFHQLFNSFFLFRKLKKSDDFNYVICRSFLPLLSARLAGFKNIKYLVASVVYSQSRLSSSARRSFFSIKVKLDIVLQFISFFISDVYVFSQSIKKQVELTSFNLVHPRLVNPGINFSRFNLTDEQSKLQIKTDLKLPSDKKIILCLGRFSDLKQFDLVVQAMNEISEKYYLVLVGDGPEKEKYISLASTSHASERIKIFPATESPEVFFKIADIFMMTSRYETFGQVLLEATASGAKIVAFTKESGVNTAVEDIYKGYNNLIRYADEQSVKGLTDALKNYDFFLDDRFYKEREVFLKSYSWGGLIKELSS